jgi:ribonuclease P protein component
MRRSETAPTIEQVKARTLTFGKDKRLTKSAEFARVREEGRVYRGELLAIGTRIEEEASGFRAGFVTSRKIGGAVVRNRVRRRLREIVRKYQGDLRSGISIVTIARPAAARFSYGALEDEWLRLARRASILARS